MTNFDYIDTNLKADNLIRRLSADSPSMYPFDIETTGLSPHSAQILLIQFQIPHTQEIYIVNCVTVDYDKLERIVEVLWRGGKGQLLGHNLKFDLSFLNVFFPKVYFDNVRDTFIIEQLITNGIILKPPSLAELSSKYLNIDLSKEERSSFLHWTGGEFTKEQLEYSAVDVEVLRPIYMEQRNHIADLQLDLIVDIECRAVPAFAKMEVDGIFVSKKKWDDNLNIAKERRYQILTQLNDYAVKVFPPKENLFKDTISSINWNSPQQVLKLLQKTVSTGIKDTNEKTIMNYQHPLIDLLLEYREQEKVITSYGDTVLAQINKKTGRLHPSFNQLGAKTGRVSCIEENQLVPIVGGFKKIKDIKPGDLVFSYTDDNKITIKPVTKVFNNGKQDCIKIKWRSTGVWDTGELICTPDHLIKSHNGWKRADQLCTKEKLIHLRKERFGNRVRVYGFNSMSLEEHLIKSEYFKASNHDHIHHINGKTDDNRISNLQILPADEHSRLHGLERASKELVKTERLEKYHGTFSFLGEENVRYINISKFSFLKEIAKACGRPTKTLYDYSTILNRADKFGIKVSDISKRYNNKGQFLSKGWILRTILNHNMEESSLILGIGTRRLKYLCNLYKLACNHEIVSIEKYKTCNVYDLEVEGTHCFIASEILVHNCREPNVQQVPKNIVIDENGIEHSIYREAFVPQVETGYMVGADYSSFELRVLTDLTKEPKWIEGYTDDLDMHSVVASFVFNTKVSKKERPELREIGKAINFGIALNPCAIKTRSIAGTPNVKTRAISSQTPKRFGSNGSTTAYFIYG